MFDLESALNHWRNQLGASVKAATLCELENHLREEVDRLTRGGATTEEAFSQALNNLGEPAHLSAEFAKLKPRGTWLPARAAGLITLSLLGVLLIVFSTSYFSGNRSLLITVHVFTVSMGYLTAFILGALGVCFVLARPFRRLNPIQSTYLRQSAWRLGMIASAMTAFGIVCGMLWAKKEWGRYWGWDAKEVGGLAILSWTLLITFLTGNKRVGVRTLMALTIVGNAVTALGWFGANLIYLHGSLSVYLAAFLGAQLIILALAFLPEQKLPARNA